MNKKASVFDTLMLAITLFAFGLIIIFAYMVMGNLNTEFQAREDMSSNAKTHMSDLKGRYVGLFDGIFATVLILVGLAIAVGVYFLDIHPVFYVVSLMVIIFTVIVSAVFGNVFSDVTDDIAISSEIAEFDLMPFIMDNYVMFILVLSFIIVIVMYAKYRGIE